MEASTQGVPGYFVWQAPGQPTIVQLSIDVVDRMGADIMRGFGLVPKRGAEVGGILIGTIKSDIIRIEDFEAVPCTYARGPSYLLTDAERASFEEACQRRGTEAIGYYRSHTREGLVLQPEDIHLLERHFQLALLVKPFATKPSNAGFFVRENGVFPTATLLEFPFRRWEMTGKSRPGAPRCRKGSARNESQKKLRKIRRLRRRPQPRRSHTIESSPPNRRSCRPRRPKSQVRQNRGLACGWWRVLSFCS